MEQSEGGGEGGGVRRGGRGGQAVQGLVNSGF